MHAEAHSPAPPSRLRRALFAAGRPQESLAQMRQAVLLDPQDELLHLDLGKVLADMGQLADAVRSFQQALKINAEYGQAHEGLGVAYIRLGRFTDAGFDHVYVHQIGPEQQGFIDFYASEVLPRVKERQRATAR